MINIIKINKNAGKIIDDNGTMKKRTIIYDSIVDALVGVAKRLSLYENMYQMSSEDFFDKYQKGKMGDSVDFVEWSNDYRTYMTLRADLEKSISNVA